MKAATTDLCVSESFMFFMLILVLAANYVLLFVGWKALASRATCSSLLFSEKVRIGSGKKAFIVNRIGDFGFHARHVPALPHIRHAGLHTTV